MSRVERRAGSGHGERAASATNRSSSRSYIVRTDHDRARSSAARRRPRPGRPGSAARRCVTSAVTGPSDTSSCQPSLLAKSLSRLPSALAARDAAPAEDDQPPVVVGAQLAEVDRLPHELAGVERDTPARRGRGPLIVRGPGSIDELPRAAPTTPRCAAATAAARSLASGMSSAIWNSYQAAFVFATWTVQRDVGVVGGQLARPPRRPRCSRRRGSAPPAASAPPPRPCRSRAAPARVGHLGADEELVRAVADARDADRRMDRGPHDPAVVGSRSLGRLPAARRLPEGDTVRSRRRSAAAW